MRNVKIEWEDSEIDGNTILVTGRICPKLERGELIGNCEIYKNKIVIITDKKVIQRILS